MEHLQSQLLEFEFRKSSGQVPATFWKANYNVIVDSYLKEHL